MSDTQLTPIYHNFGLIKLVLRCSATFLMNYSVVLYLFLGTSFESYTQMAKSFVIKPFSTVSITEFSRVWQKFSSCLLLSSFARCKSPLVHAKMLAIELVDVYFPF
jgi:hypothetical protein